MRSGRPWRRRRRPKRLGEVRGGECAGYAPCPCRRKIRWRRYWSPVRRRAGRTAPSGWRAARARSRSEEHTSELQSRPHLVCRLLLEKKKNNGRVLVHEPGARGNSVTPPIIVAV